MNPHGMKHVHPARRFVFIATEASRAADARRTLRPRATSRSRAVNVEASGIQRSVMNAFTLASGVSGKVRIFKEVSDGVPSLLRRIVMDVDAEDLSRAISRFRDAG